MTSRIVTVFRSRLNPGIDTDYADVAQRMNDLATQMPGYIEHKSFLADDGERVTIVTFADQASHDAWRNHPEHRAAQQAGRERFYSEYSLTVAEVRHHREFPAG
jgi:heme-degrading monooxygenase HmoA